MNKAGILIGALVIAAASYSGIWWHKSNELKDRVGHAIAEMSKQDNSSIALTYDKMERAGYPFEIELSFTNPKLVEKTNKAEVIHSGNVTVGQSLFDREKIWIKTKGKTTIKIVKPNEEQNSGGDRLVLAGNSFFECTSCGGHLHLVNNMIRSDLTFAEWIPIILSDSTLKLNDFSIAQAGAKDQPDLQEIGRIQKGVFKVQNKVDKGNNHFSIDIDAEKMSSYASPQSLEELSQTFPGVSKDELRKTFFDLGKADLVFQAHGFFPTLDHPFYSSPSLATLPSFSFVIDKSDYKSDLYSHDSDLQAKFDKLADHQFKGLFQFDQESKATEKMHPVLVKIVQLFIRKGQTSDEMDEDTKAIAQVLADHANELVPNLAQFGTIKNKVDLDFQGKVAKHPNSFEQGVIVLKDYKLGSDQYELNLDGKIEKKEAGNHSGDLNVHLKNYKELFNDMLNYYNKFQKLLAQASVKNQMPVISQEYVEKIERFLESLSTTSSSNQLNIPFVYEDANHIQIGNKPLDQVSESFNQLVKDLDAEYKKQNPQSATKADAENSMDNDSDGSDSDS